MTRGYFVHYWGGGPPYIDGSRLCAPRSSRVPFASCLPLSHNRGTTIQCEHSRPGTERTNGDVRPRTVPRSCGPTVPQTDPEVGSRESGLGGGTPPIVRPRVGRIWYLWVFRSFRFRGTPGEGSNRYGSGERWRPPGTGTNFKRSNALRWSDKGIIINHCI